MKGKKGTSIFFHSFSWLIILSLWHFDLLFFMNVPGYTYRVSLDWLRAVKSGFVQCFKHSPQCPTSASYPHFTPPLGDLVPSNWWELETGRYTTKAGGFLHDKTQVQALLAAVRPTAYMTAVLASDWSRDELCQTTTIIKTWRTQRQQCEIVGLCKNNDLCLQGSPLSKRLLQPAFGAVIS